MSGDLVASDLDRTLIYSARALHLDETSAGVGSSTVSDPGTSDDSTSDRSALDLDAPLLTVSEIYRGEPLSFMTRAAEEQLAALAAEVVFVPVTTRTVAQFRRVRLPTVRFEYAVTTNGGVLLHHGEPDGDWADTVTRRLEGRCAPLGEVESLLPDPHDDGWILRFSRAEDHFVYAIVQRDQLIEGSAAADSLATLTTEVERRGWTVSLQGRKLYLVPAPLTKSAAIAEVASRVGASRVLAAGDSLLDLDLLDFADVAYRPAHGELHDLGVARPHLGVTEARGVRAGEEIVSRLRADVAAGVPSVAR